MARSAYSRQVEAEAEMRRAYQRAKDARRPSGSAPPTATAPQERAYGEAHQRASKHRRQAAMRVDAASREHGETLGWYAEIDDKTTPECLAAHGSNFRVSNPPAIGYPGTVHAECRCTPGPPHAGAETMGTYGEAQAASNMNTFIRRAARSARRTFKQLFGRENG